jgi:hypothetical protein
MSGRIYLLTEGVHDVYFLGKILEKSLEFKRNNSFKELEAEWRILVPTQFPHEDSLRASMPVPTFYRSTDASVAIVNAEGINKIKSKLDAHLKQLANKGFALDAIGIVLDADFERAKQKSPAERFNEMATYLENLGYPRPTMMDKVEKNPGIRTGIFIMPGGGALGTLDDLLLECADTIYAPLADRAREFIGRLDTQNPSYFTNEEKADFINSLRSDEQEEFNKPSGRNKAIIAAMIAFLRPGKPTQASIEDHRWVGKETLVLPRMAAVQKFLLDLVGDIPTTTTS